MYKASFPTVISIYQKVFQGFLLESQKLAHPAIQADPLPASSNSIPWFSHSNLPLLQEFSSLVWLQERNKKTCPLMTGPKWLGMRVAGWNRTLRIQMLEHYPYQYWPSNFCLVKKLETCHIHPYSDFDPSTRFNKRYHHLGIGPDKWTAAKSYFFLHAWDIEAIRISWVYAVHVLIIDGSNIKYLTLLKLFWIYICLKAYLSFPKADSCFALLGTKVGCNVQAVDPSWKWICHLEHRWRCFKK